MAENIAKSVLKILVMGSLEWGERLRGLGCLTQRELTLYISDHVPKCGKDGEIFSKVKFIFLITKSIMLKLESILPKIYFSFAFSLEGDCLDF